MYISAFVSVKECSEVLSECILICALMTFFLYLCFFLEYTDDNALIPKNSSVIVRRIPIGGVKATSKTYVM